MDDGPQTMARVYEIVYGPSSIVCGLFQELGDSFKDGSQDFLIGEIDQTK